MKLVLGLDLGVGSVGWALIFITDSGEPIKILALGERIVSMDPDNSKEFSAGATCTLNQKKTKAKSVRKGYSRYVQRRDALTAELRHIGMMPDETLIKLPVLDLWQLRANAATEGKKLSLAEIGRVLYHINQRRGYKHGKSDVSSDNKQKGYVKAVNERYCMIQERQQTIGQYFALKLKETAVTTEKGTFYTFRIKDQVFPREAYEEEFDRIIECQKKFYPELLTEKVIDKLRNYIIFYQRHGKSCKHLVSVCDFERKPYKDENGKVFYNGPKVAAKSNPLYQIEKIWEEVNNISLRNKKGEELEITLVQKRELFNYLNTHEILRLTVLYKILGISKRDGWSANDAVKRGLKGNTTFVQLQKALQGVEDCEELLRFQLNNMPTVVCDEVTGESLQMVNPDCIGQPLYRLWHAIYSLKDKRQLKDTLRKNFKIEDDETIDLLYNIDFTKDGYGNKSVKVIRRLLPYLQAGLKYNEACEYIGINHSNSLTKEENAQRVLLEKLPQIGKNELRQPIVEKILNQMINVVNAIIAKYGRPDTIRVELARELKQSKEERKLMSDGIVAREREKKRDGKILEEEGIHPTKNRLERYRLWKETGERCLYCGNGINLNEFLRGGEVETEHIIPKALLFDNSYSNKTCSCRECNRKKGRRTAYEYVSSLGEERFEVYLNVVKMLYDEGKISKKKMDWLLMKSEDIPQDFINRDLRQTQYISRKAMELLQKVCYDVTATSGHVTSFIRHVWGYDTILHKLNFNRYKQGGLTEVVQFEHRGGKHEREVISGWNKRLDHRHHAIDALVIAMTKQSVIQRLNTLNTCRDEMYQEVESEKKEWRDDYSLLEQWLRELKHFSVEEVQMAIAKTLVSYKVNKKITSPGTRAVYSKRKKKVVQRGILIPRGVLHEDSVYGKIKIQGDLDPVYVIKYKLGVGAMGFVFTGKETYEETIKSNKKTGLEEVKVKDDIGNTLMSIVDGNIRNRIKQRLNIGFPEGEDYRNNPQKALENLKDLDNYPLYADDACKIPIKSVRCRTGLSAVVPLRYNGEGQAVGFVKTGNNHHVAIYRDRDGGYHESIVTFWQAVSRKRFGIPAIIEQPPALWESISSGLEREIPKSILETFPEPEWTFIVSMQKNESFILGMEEDDYQRAMEEKDYAALGNNLYVVQNISSMVYRFCLSTTTIFDPQKMNKPDKRFLNIQSFQAFFDKNPHKIKIDLLGEIVNN